MENETISAEAAQAQLDGLLNHYEIDIDEGSRMQIEARSNACARIVKAIRKGRVTIDMEAVTVTQILKNKESLVFVEMSGRHKIEMNKHGDNEDVHSRMYALMGSLSGVGFSVIAKLSGPDLTLLENLGLLFLLV